MRGLPGLLASFGEPDVPEGLADYIKGACFFSVGMEPAPPVVNRRPAIVRVAVAGAAAAVLLLVVLGATRLSSSPDPVSYETAADPKDEPPQAVAASPVASAATPRALTLVTSPSTPGRKDPAALYAGRTGIRRDAKPDRGGSLLTLSYAAGRQARTGMTSPDRPRRRAPSLPKQRSAKPALAFAPVRSPALAAPPQEPTSQMRPAGAAANSAPARTAATTSRGIAPAPKPSAKLAESPATTVAAGMIAGVLMERYLADAVAEQGAQLATMACAADLTRPKATDALTADGDLADL